MKERIANLTTKGRSRDKRKYSNCENPSTYLRTQQTKTGRNEKDSTSSVNEEK